MERESPPGLAHFHPGCVHDTHWDENGRQCSQQTRASRRRSFLCPTFYLVLTFPDQTAWLCNTGAERARVFNRFQTGE